MILGGSSVMRVPALIIGAVLVNAALFSLLAVFSQERSPPHDDIDATGVNLVTLSPPEPPTPETVEEPEPPEPEPPVDFQPDLRPQSFDLGVAGIDPGLAIDLDAFAPGDLHVAPVFEAGDLDAQPEAVVRMLDNYPYRARQRGIKGVVQVKLLVNVDGSVGEVRILSASPEGVFEDAVRKAVPRWKFRPGRIAGEPVASWVVTNVRFTLDGR